ncbi:MAG: lactoylglutathione lyase [Hyphomicrobiales bacterium]|jgi:lactoylglutathione lyase|nr:MAG: lactoylglutathione lyase [Hyphomicrobiales bacterium]
MKFLHSMIRVGDLDRSLHFFCDILGLKEVRRTENDKGRYTLVYLAAPTDLDEARRSGAPTIELTYNWDEHEYGGGRNFGHLAFAVEDIYEICERLQKAGVTISRPPRDGHMAFVRTPDAISIELLQKGEPLPPKEPWASAANVGVW